MNNIKRGIPGRQELIKRKAGAASSAERQDQCFPRPASRTRGRQSNAATTYARLARDYYTADPTKATSICARRLARLCTEEDAAQRTCRFAALYNALCHGHQAPYNHVELALDWAIELSRLQQFAEAIKFLHMVPKESAQYPAAKYFELLSWEQLLDTKQSLRSAQTVSGLKRLLKNCAA